MTFLKTVAEDINAFTCCSQTWTAYFQCFFHTWCAYEDTQVRWGLLPDQPSGTGTDRSPALSPRQGCSLQHWPWRTPAEPVNGMWAAWSPCSCDLWLSAPEGISSTWKLLESLNWFESAFCTEVLSLLGARWSHGKPWEALLLSLSRTESLKRRKNYVSFD